MSNLKDKDLLEYEIAKGKADKKYYQKLAKNLGFKDIRDVTSRAVKSDNVSALMAIAESNIYALTAELSSGEYAAYFADKEKQQAMESFLPQLFFMVRSHAPARFRIMLRNLTRSIILRTALNIAGRGNRGKNRFYTRYHPGLNEFDLDRTIHNFIQQGQRLVMSDIVGIQRRQEKKNVVLILDTSGSMYGQLLLNATLTTSVLSYVMNKDFVSVILFSGETFVLKGIQEIRQIGKLIDQILESEATGFTNISRALSKGLQELKRVHKAGSRKSFGILISDGEYNRGQDPVEIARQFPCLHVIGLPAESSKAHLAVGQSVCKEIAKAGRGYYLPVKQYQEIPRTLMQLLSKT
jgi:Mg-chelatase subunit ChlD